MIDQAGALALLQECLGDLGTGWSIGTFGALAEFHHVASDPPPGITLTGCGGDVVTGRGAIRAALCGEVLPVAYEGLTKDPRGWNQTLSFCLREECAGMAGRAVLTELGRDDGAMREIDREAILFDVGIGAAQVDFCVRTDDPNLVATLHQAAGQSILEAGHPALAAIAATSPHRVAISRLGRIEVYQPIPSGDDARSPIGPHTHLLLQLLRNGRSHSANVPIPDGWTPALNLYPPSPITDGMGRPRPFALDAHAAFQALLRAYALPGVVAEKERIMGAVRAGERPQHYTVAPSRAERKAARVALRQMLYTHHDHPNLPAWIAAFDRAAGTCDADA